MNTISTMQAWRATGTAVAIELLESARRELGKGEGLQDVLAMAWGMGRELENGAFERTSRRGDVAAALVRAERLACVFGRDSQETCGPSSGCSYCGHGAHEGECKALVAAVWSNGYRRCLCVSE